MPFACRLQISVDRARAQAHNVLRRSMAELRHLQTERSIRFEVFGPNDTSARDLTSYSDVVKFLNNHDRGKLLARKLDGIDTVASVMRLPTDAPAAELGSSCKTPPPVLPRAA